MKFKALTKNQIIISLDRLTRFKQTKEKYLRVFGDIIISNLIEPKFRKHDLSVMDISKIRDYAVEIINASIEDLVLNKNQKNDRKINNILLSYENSVYNNDDDTQFLIDNNINYADAISLIDEKNSAVNLRWLKSLKDTNDIITSRKNFALKFPVEKVLLVEGITEEILLPCFSKLLGFDFYKEGVQIIPAGGKNQVVKMYYKLADELKIPIFLLLDKDAEENIKQIQPKLRNIDRIHLVSCGEFEDILPKSLIIKTVNKELNNFASITESDFMEDISNAKNLENIFKKMGTHEFKKADFAKQIRDNLTSVEDISSEIQTIINEIFCN